MIYQVLPDLLAREVATRHGLSTRGHDDSGPVHPIVEFQTAIALWVPMSIPDNCEVWDFMQHGPQSIVEGLAPTSMALLANLVRSYSGRSGSSNTRRR